jgi:hypothetical protein
MFNTSASDLLSTEDIEIEISICKQDKVKFYRSVDPALQGIILLVDSLPEVIYVGFVRYLGYVVLCRTLDSLVWHQDQSPAYTKEKVRVTNNYLRFITR